MSALTRALLSLLLVLAFGAPAQAGEADAAAGPLSLPAPGSYALPAIERVGDYPLLDSRGERVPMLGLAPGQVAVVSLVYATCPAACPAALAVLQEVDRSVAADPALRGRVRLVTVSFDPERDRPPQMAALRERFEPRSDWRFLTAAEPGDIDSVLAAYDQDTLRLRAAAAEPDGEDRDTPLIRHVLKVFLVDDRGDVRNIYSAGLFSRDLVLTDVRTLQRESLASVP